MTEASLQLNNIDPDDLSEMIHELEISFNIKLQDQDLSHLKTFGELCALFQRKAIGTDTHDCTSQQAFHKLRNAITATVLIDKKAIAPDTDLLQIFPRAIRRRKVAEVEKVLGFKTKLLRSRYWVGDLIFLTSFISILLLFPYWQIGVAGIAISIITGFISSKLANEMDLQTVRDLTEKVVRENYTRVRRNNQTINRAEIPALIRSAFHHRFGLADEKLTANATF